MARVIPNEQTWVGFATTVADVDTPTTAEINGAVDLTKFTMSLNASARGNTVPTPSFDSLFETSINGTSAATFDADFYRDDVTDTAWETLPRGTSGYFIIARFGGKPAVGDKCEVWPVQVSSRTAANIASNTVQTFTVSCAVNVVPGENATVAA